MFPSFNRIASGGINLTIGDPKPITFVATSAMCRNVNLLYVFETLTLPKPLCSSTLAIDLGLKS